jgi:hypothetical protein
MDLGLERRDTVVVEDMRGEKNNVPLHKLRQKPGMGY